MVCFTKVFSTQPPHRRPALHTRVGEKKDIFVVVDFALMTGQKVKNSKLKDHWLQLHRETVHVVDEDDAVRDCCLMYSWHLQCLFDLDDLGDAIVHFLDGLEFSQAHAALVGDVVDAALSLGVFSASSTDLQVVLGSDFLELSVVGGQLWHLNVH